MEEEKGYIYKITCIPTKKVYIGQTSEFKSKNGKPYRYGIAGRWSDHVSSAKRISNSLYDDINKYGKDQFKIEEVCKASKIDLDALEAHSIEKLECVVPDGYNVCKHSRNRHHVSSNFVDTYKEKTVKAVVSYIKKNSSYRFVYVRLHYNDDSSERLVFGQKQSSTFEEAKAETADFLEKLGCPFEVDTSYSEDPLERYNSKIEQFNGKIISKIRITSASKLIAVYITTDDMKSYKDQIRICFGGKGIPSEEAYELAKLFVSKLPTSQNILIEDNLTQCQQQAATFKDEAISLEEK
jgi:hypothetical protein